MTETDEARIVEHALKGDKQCPQCRKWYSAAAQFTLQWREGMNGYMKVCYACSTTDFWKHWRGGGQRCERCHTWYSSKAQFYHLGYDYVCYACATHRRPRP